MLRVFLVLEGVSLSEDLPPTSSVAKLQKSLGHQCGVGSKDIILLTPKGHLLDAEETLGSYDAGTEERPLYVYFRPGVVPHSSYIDQSYKKNPHLESQMTRLTSSPSPTALQQQLTLASEFRQEALQLVHLVQELHSQTKLQWSGWQALLLNFSSMNRIFDKHQRALDSAVRNLKESLTSYRDLLEKTPGQLEVLKMVVLPPFLSQSGVFGDERHSLYNWINSQDEHSSLDDLIKECHQTLNQVNEDTLDDLQKQATKLAEAAAELLAIEMVDITLPKTTEDLERISQEQQSMAQSLQSTVQRVLGSGDGGALANVSLSNCRLLQMMSRNHQKIESSVGELETLKSSLKERINTGLESLAKLQQKMTEVDAQLQFHCGQLQLTRRRFEVLEQICAAPDMMSCVLNEVAQRKKFKSIFVEEGGKVLQKFEELRQQEKARRQSFLDKCGQHFVISLFPSLTDRIPRLLTSVPERFDDDLCSLSQEELDALSKVLPRPSFISTSIIDSHFTVDHNTTEADNEMTTQLLEIAIQANPDCNENCSQTLTDTTNSGVQVNITSTMQTVNRTDNRTQTEVKGEDISTQTEVIGEDIGTQVEVIGEDISTQTEVIGEDISTQVEVIGVDIGTQAKVNGIEIGVQSSVELVNAFMQTKLEGIHDELRKYLEGINRAVQVAVISNEVSVQVTANETGITSATQTDIQIVDSSTQACVDVLESGVQTDTYVLDFQTHSIEATDKHELEGQVVALQAAVEGLKSQLVLERENHMKEMIEKDRGIKQLRRSYSKLNESQEHPETLTINIANLKIGDTAIFMQDSHANFLALTVDGRIYYLHHDSVDRFTTDISNKIIVPIRRKLVLGTITEKILVEVRKEANRLHVPVGQRLYKVSAQEVLVPVFQ